MVRSRTGARRTPVGYNRTADRELKGEVVELDILMQFLRIKERRNVTATALADKSDLLGEANPDVELKDVKAVAAHASMRRREGRGGAPP